MTPPPASLPARGSVIVSVHGEKKSIPVIETRAVVIGSGAAGLNAAIHLSEHGFKAGELAIITEEWGGGTSFNSGSDKQTYYKLSISGIGTDSPLLMARDFYSGGSMHGDIALAEAAGSIEEFFHLIRLGVRFPSDDYGLYPGYQTDNDFRQRATSVGPYTSREMVACLAKEVARIGIPVLDKHLAVALLVDEISSQKRVVGVACIDLRKIPDVQATIDSFKSIPFTIIHAPVVILATGGPANLFHDSVYPEKQHCSHGLGIEAGASLQNLAFMQYGIASVKFRWNLSGSFQQVLPSYWVEGKKPGDRVEVLRSWLPSIADVANQTFLKGYNWPFNPEKCNPQAENHSSLIDLAVHDAVVNMGKMVFLDFRVNPWDLTREKFTFKELTVEARQFLEKSKVNQATPIERLAKLNPFAIQVYKDHGIDLAAEAIQIHVAVQHCNGGFAGDSNWESIDVKGLYPVGEVNGSHGQHRPGGAALNAGQVGGLRAALHAASMPMHIQSPSKLEEIAAMAFGRLFGSIDIGKSKASSRRFTMAPFMDEIKTRMTRAAGIVRLPDMLKQSITDAKQLVEKVGMISSVTTWTDLIDF
nr:FAD-binding protein [Candidatus Sigynarchaeota archaeon]